MMRHIGIVLALAAGLGASGARAQQTVPQWLSYEGHLLTTAGAAASGSQSIQFALFTSATGGTAAWSDTLPVQVASNGLYSVTLGTTSGNTIPAGLLDGQALYLEITVNGDTLTPRQSVGSVAYAITAGSLQGGPVNATSIKITPSGNTTSAYQVYYAESESLPLSNGGSPVNGAVVGDATASAGSATELVNAVRHGPGITLTPGNYVYVTRLKITGSPPYNDAITLDVNSATLGHLIASRVVTAAELSTAWQTFAVPFSMNQTETDVEVRITNTTNSTSFVVYEDYVMIVPDQIASRPGHGSKTFVVPQTDATLTACGTYFGCGSPYNCGVTLACGVTCGARWCQTLGVGYAGGTISECGNGVVDINCF